MEDEGKAMLGEFLCEAEAYSIAGAGDESPGFGWAVMVSRKGGCADEEGVYECGGFDGEIGESHQAYSGQELGR